MRNETVTLIEERSPWSGYRVERIAYWGATLGYEISRESRNTDSGWRHICVEPNWENVNTTIKADMVTCGDPRVAAGRLA